MIDPVRILFEDNHLLVLDKPAGLVTQGAQANQPSLVEDARQYLKIKYHKPGNVFIGVVSRLDRQVSGVIVLARTSKAAARLNQQFSQGDVVKRYWALIPTAPSIPAQGALIHYVRKDELKQRMVAEVKPRADRQIAKLSYRVLGEKNHVRLVEVWLETGRKHQIRVQLAALGVPILGDTKYGSRRDFPVGIGLHSHVLEFEHPIQKNRLTFACSPPEYWSFHTSGIH
jgi:23S rRNA pseudouridine1911/1915/1917 synthase